MTAPALALPLLAAPTCPDWCRGVCRNCNNQCSNPNCAFLHAQHDTVIEGINVLTDGDECGQLNYAEVGLGRQDTADKPGDVFIGLGIEEYPLHLSPAQARELASILNHLADQGERS